MLFKALLLPLAASAAILGQRDTAATNIVVEKLEPRYRKTANRNRYKLGPYTISGAKGALGDSTSWGQAFFYTMPKTLCNKDGPCTILAAKVGVAFTDGKEANPSSGIYIHHILTSDSTKRQSSWLSNCGSSSSPAMNIAGLLGGTAFVGTGEDSADGLSLYTSEDGRRNTGYHVGASDSFTGWAQLVNYNPTAKQVYVYYDLEWVPGITGADVKTATFTATCGTSPAIRLSTSGPTNTTSGKFHFMEDGHILRARGHLHDGGVRMEMYHNNKFLCASDAIYGARGESEGHGHPAMSSEISSSPKGGASAPKGGAPPSQAAPPKGGAPPSQAASPKGGSDASIKTISSMTTCWGPFPVKKGDTLTLSAIYDLSKHPLRTSASGSKQADVMGMWGISFSNAKDITQT